MSPLFNKRTAHTFVAHPANEGKNFYYHIYTRLGDDDDDAMLHVIDAKVATAALQQLGTSIQFIFLFNNV